jgi:hypothetical protein
MQLQHTCSKRSFSPIPAGIRLSSHAERTPEPSMSASEFIPDTTDLTALRAAMT